MRTALRFLITLSLAGIMLAAGLVALAPEVKAVLGSGEGNAGGLEQLSQLSQRSLIYSRDGRLLAVLHAEENRSPVPLGRVPRHVINAILDMEDERFWQHGGVDLRSTGRALLTNIDAGEVRQGGSTITQQLVKNALLTPERSVDRKLKEAVLAVRLEDQMTKSEILERYLNTVYFGNGAYGVQAAAETYWGVDISKLGIAEGAFLAGMIRNPNGYDPFKHPALATERRNLALDRMVELGHLSTAAHTELKKRSIPLFRLSPLPPPNDYFVEEVKQRLLNDRRLGETAVERYNALFKGGLRIYTTLDRRMQTLAKEKMDSILPNTKGKFTAALVSLEPDTGAVRAMVGGENFEKAKFNLATQGRRQPGSSFKTFVLVAALENGYGPRDSINGTSPCPVKQGGGKPWLPANYEGSAGGIMSVSSATAKSVNCAYVRLGLKVGLDKVAATAKKMGLTTQIDELPAMSLGSEEVKPLDMASAYGVLANDGIRHAPTFVERVMDRNGKELFKGTDKGKRVVTEHVSRMTTQVLRGVVEGGTAARARLPGRQVAGKTGTSQNHENAWFVGYTPQLSTAVWMGAPVGNISMRGVGGVSVTGGSFPARIWGAFMKEALVGTQPKAFPAPDPKQIPRAKSISDPPEARGRGVPCEPTEETVTTLYGTRCVPTSVPAEGVPPEVPFTGLPPQESTTTTAPPTTTTETTQPPNPPNNGTTTTSAPPNPPNNGTTTTAPSG